jgi:hypothetical protein
LTRLLNKHNQITAIRNNPRSRFSDQEIANFDLELGELTQEHQNIKDERITVISDLVYYRDSILRPAETRREEIIQEIRDLLPKARDLSPESLEQAKEALSLTQKSINETKEELELPVIEQGFLYRDLHAGIKINYHIAKKKLPAGVYVFLTMPYKMALLHPKLYFNLFAIFGINFSYF